LKGRYVGTSSKDVEDDEDEMAFSSLCFLDEVPEKKSIGLSKFRLTKRSHSERITNVREFNICETSTQMLVFFTFVTQRNI
jgi:hypothetical protein